MIPFDLERVWRALRGIDDPELGVDIVGLGMVEDVSFDGSTVRVALRESFVACIAVPIIRDEVCRVLARMGLSPTVVDGRRWRGSDVDQGARSELASLGIAVDSGEDDIACPYCGSPRVAMDSPFGAAPCRAAWSCLACETPFDVMRSADIRARGMPAAITQLPGGPR